MKKEVVIRFFVLTILIVLLGFLVASSEDEEAFNGQIKRATHYAENYESGNVNYPQLIVYLSSVKEELNNILLNFDKNLIEEELTPILGAPEKTTVALSVDGISDVQVSDPVSTWINTIIFDGNKIQIKINAVPIISDNKIITYKADFTTIFKESITEENLKSKIADIEKLAKTYSLDPNIENANKLADGSVYVEKISDLYFKQTNKKCEDTMQELIGEEGLKIKEETAIKDYEFYNKDGYSVVSTLSLLEKYSGVGEKTWIAFGFTFKKNEKIIRYNIIEDTSDSFSGLGINGIKTKFIELNSRAKQALTSKDYSGAYSNFKQMEALTKALNEKINQEKNQELAFVDAVKFFNGLLEGYPLVATAYEKNDVFEKILIREFKNVSQEICNNEEDDNNDTKIDCEDQTCIGQVCGTKTANVTINGTTKEQNILLYCIDGECKEKIEKKDIKTIICGNDICEEDEDKTCKKDCVKCPTYPPIECSGKIIFRGVDTNGCQLEPTCIQEKTCTTNTDCIQPLCGKSECIQGLSGKKSCQLTKLGLCSQPKCQDWEEKLQKCGSGEDIVIEKCNNGNWESTGLKCQVIIGEPIISSITEQQGCDLKDLCGEGMVCSGGVCKPLPVNTKTNIKPTITGVAFTNKVVSIDMTGKSITATGITGIWTPTPEQENVLGKVDPNNIPQRTYETKKQASSLLTGVSRTEISEEEMTEFEKEKELLTSKSPGEMKLTEGEKKTFALIGTCTTKKQETQASLYFNGAGEEFDSLISLKEKYQEKGSWCNVQLKEELQKRKAFETSLNSFPDWFFEYLANDAESWENKEKAIFNVYDEIINNLEEIGHMMDCTGFKEVDFTPITIDYKSPDGSFTLQYTEELKETTLNGMTRAVILPNPHMKILIFPSLNLIENQLIKDMDANTFPSSIVERKKNQGLDDYELMEFKSDAALKEDIKNFIATNNINDNVIDFQFTVINAEEKSIYNIYGRLNEEGIQMQPMSIEETPSPLDIKVTVNSKDMYNLIYSSSKDKMETIAVNPPWDKSGFNPVTIVKSTIRAIDIKTKAIKMTNSLQITPANPDAEELFSKIFYVIAGEETQNS